jgi:hypothetical protein
VTERLSKPLLAARLKAAGFVLTSTHWRQLDALLKRGNGYITPHAVRIAAGGWKWSQPMLAQLWAALTRKDAA